VLASAEAGAKPHRITNVGYVPLRALVRIDGLFHVEREDMLPALEEHHVLKAETVAKRFHYRKPGIWVLRARVWRGEVAHSVVVTPEQAGCKTWVMLETALDTNGLTPVFDDVEWEEKRKSLEVKLESAIS
jgi:hypothetical protein